MTDRILDFSQRPAHLALRNGLLRIEWKDDSEALEIPLGEIGAVVLAHREITVTQAALAGLAAALVPTIICDDRFRPVGLMLPIEGHQEQQRRFRAQAALSYPARNACGNSSSGQKSKRRRKSWNIPRESTSGYELTPAALGREIPPMWKLRPPGAIGLASSSSPKSMPRNSYGPMTRTLETIC